MNNQKIRSITESFSMQPATLQVIDDPEMYFDPDAACVEIKVGHATREGNPYECFRGYNRHGEVLFRYWSGSVNVHYYTKSK